MVIYGMLKCQERLLEARYAHTPVGWSQISLMHSGCLCESAHKHDLVCLFVGFFSVYLCVHFILYLNFQIIVLEICIVPSNAAVIFLFIYIYIYMYIYMYICIFIYIYIYIYLYIYIYIYI